MKFKVQVTVKAEVTYTVEVDERNESTAEDAACAMWRTELPSDFQVEKGYITDWEVETEQQTNDCEECGKEYAVPTADQPNAPLAWKEDQFFCADCGAKIAAEDDALQQKAGTL